MREKEKERGGRNDRKGKEEVRDYRKEERREEI